MKFLFILCINLISSQLQVNADETTDADSIETTEISGDRFSNPILSSAPGPWVWQKDGYYYFTHTTANNLKLNRTKEMKGLSFCKKIINCSSCIQPVGAGQMTTL